MGNDSHVCKWTSVYFFNILQFSKTWSWAKHLFISHYLVTLVFKIDLSASWSWSRPCHGTNICSWSMASWRIINLAILRKKVQNGMVLPSATLTVYACLSRNDYHFLYENMLKVERNHWVTRRDRKEERTLRQPPADWLVPAAKMAWIWSYVFPLVSGTVATTRRQPAAQQPP